MYATETPILESVFVDVAPDAAGIADVISEGLSPDVAHWFFLPLSYPELLEWTEESSAA